MTTLVAELVAELDTQLTTDKTDLILFSMVLGQISNQLHDTTALIQMFGNIYDIKKDVPQDWNVSKAERFNFIIDWLNSKVLKLWIYEAHSPFMVDHFTHNSMLGYTCITATTILLHLCRTLNLEESDAYAAGSLDHVWVEFVDENRVLRYDIEEDRDGSNVMFAQVEETAHINYLQNRTENTIKEDRVFLGMLLETLLKIILKSYQKSNNDKDTQMTLIDLVKLCTKHAYKLHLTESSNWLCILASILELDAFQDVENENSTTKKLMDDKEIKNYLEKATVKDTIQKMVGELYKKADAISKSLNLNALLGCARFYSYSNDFKIALPFVLRAQEFEEMYYLNTRLEEVIQTKCILNAIGYGHVQSEQSKYTMMKGFLELLHQVMEFENRNLFLMQNMPLIQKMLNNVTNEIYEEFYLDVIRRNLTLVGLKCEHFTAQEWEKNKIELQNDCCSYDLGFVLQSVYTCMDCSRFCEEPIGFCESCARKCHAQCGHMVAEIGEKMFKCDCGNSKFLINKCRLQPEKDPINVQNIYNHNFSVGGCKPRYCYCDQEDDESEERIQCIACYDWFHNIEKCVGFALTKKQAETFVCRDCIRVSGKRKSQVNSEEFNKVQKLETESELDK
jgi:hypothetical protein